MNRHHLSRCLPRNPDAGEVWISNEDGTNADAVWKILYFIYRLVYTLTVVSPYFLKDFKGFYRFTMHFRKVRNLINKKACL